MMSQRKTRPLVVVLVLWLAALAVPLAGCTIVCTDAGCYNTATLVIDGPPGSLDPFHGEARLDDGRVIGWSCPGGTTEDATLEITCDPDGTRIVLATFDDAVVVGTSVVLADGTPFEVEFGNAVERAPNGEECGPICYSSDAELSFAE